MILHALYAEADEWVLRVVESQGDAIEGKLSLRAAHATDFLDENVSPLMERSAMIENNPHLTRRIRH